MVEPGKWLNYTPALFWHTKNIMADAMTSCVAIRARDGTIHTQWKLAKRDQSPRSLCLPISPPRVISTCKELVSPPWSCKQGLLGRTQVAGGSLATRVFGKCHFRFYPLCFRKKARRGLEWLLVKPMHSFSRRSWWDPGKVAELAGKRRREETDVSCGGIETLSWPQSLP